MTTSKTVGCILEQQLRNTFSCFSARKPFCVWWKFWGFPVTLIATHPLVCMSNPLSTHDVNSEWCMELHLEVVPACKQAPACPDNLYLLTLRTWQVLTLGLISLFILMLKLKKVMTNYWKLWIKGKVNNHVIFFFNVSIVLVIGQYTKTCDGLQLQVRTT